MKRWMGLLARLGYLAGAVASAACTPGGVPPSTPLRDAEASFLVFTEVSIEPVSGVGQSPVDAIRTRGGEIVRLELTSDRPIEIGERVRSGSGFAEIWTASTPQQHTLSLRTSLFTDAVLVRRGAVARAFTGAGSDPGYHWFDLEDRVLAWAEGPLRAPFPPVAPPGRIDFEGFSALDGALDDAVSHATDKPRALAASKAVRRVAGLRAVRAIRPPSGFPYFLDYPVVPAGHPRTGVDRERVTYEVSPKEPLTLEVEGPALLHVGSKAARADTAQEIDLRVFESNRERARSSLISPRPAPGLGDRSAVTTAAPGPAANAPLRPAKADAKTASEAALLPLPRAVVHVPPGSHTYRVEVTGGAVYVAPTLARPVDHVAEALRGDRSESRQLKVARETCLSSDAPAICAIALGLLGEDSKGSGAASELSWSAALAASPPAARDVAESVASGGPRDPTLRLERAASQGDRSALATLTQLASSSVEDHTRQAWLRSIEHGTSWSVADTEPKGDRWLMLAVDHASASPACVTAAEQAWPEVTSTESLFAGSVWHGTPTLELVAAGSCDEKSPVEMVIDGDTLKAQPSAGLVRWHVRVHGAEARARRVDGGQTHVYAAPHALASCGARWESVRAPHLASNSPALLFGAASSSVGVEVWLRKGTARGELTVTPLHPSGEARSPLRVLVAATPGTSALDAKGVVWERAARVALPPWAALGVQVTGSADLAVRAQVRTPVLAEKERPSDPAPEPLDEKDLVAASREILAAKPSARGPLYLTRALLLARGGASKGAYNDARAARALGARGPLGEDALALVSAARRSNASKVDPLPEALHAYGVESDFDEGASRCAAGKGPRASLESMAVDPQGSADPVAESVRVYDPALVARALDLSHDLPYDPRGASLITRVFTGSRWKTLKVKGMEKARVKRGLSRSREEPTDPSGVLRTRVAAGRPFADDTYATILPSRPAKAVFGGQSAAKSARVDVVCVPRASEVDTGSCPLQITAGGEPPRLPELKPDGSASVTIALNVGRPTSVSLALGPTRGQWGALARIVLDQEAPNTTQVPGVGWVLDPPHVEYRYLLAAGETLSAKGTSAGAIRIDALAEPGAHAKVTAVVGKQERDVPTDGTPIVIGLHEPGDVSVKVTGGAVTVSIAERAPGDESLGDESNVWAGVEAPPASPIAGAPQEPAFSLDPNGTLGRGHPAWLDLVDRSPRPLTPFQASLGTLYAGSGVVAGTLQRPPFAGPAPDVYGFMFAEYRRRIESIGLWANLHGTIRARKGEPTYAGGASLYWDAEPTHLRMMASLGVHDQRVDGADAHAVTPSAFVEYSFRATPSFFILPRLGYDGFYPSLHASPRSLAPVDDDVFNSFRGRHPTLLFAQALFWYVPLFNDIFYLRARATTDPTSEVIDHLSARPGAFFAFDIFAVSGYFDGMWYSKTSSPGRPARLDASGSLKMSANLWWPGLGSFALQPGGAAYYRASDHGWQLVAYLDVIASFRRGLRDFSSLELDFPEQLSDGIPWRSSTLGGYR